MSEGDEIPALLCFSLRGTRVCTTWTLLQNKGENMGAQPLLWTRAVLAGLWGAFCRCKGRDLLAGTCSVEYLTLRASVFPGGS